MNKIIFYKLNGEIDCIEPLNNITLECINGMKVKCHLKDNSIKIGFADLFRTYNDIFDNKIHDYINIWTWDNIDENEHKLIGNDNSKYNKTFIPVKISEIIKIEAILYSNPRWGAELTNQFRFCNESLNDNMNADLELPKFLKK